MHHRNRQRLLQLLHMLIHPGKFQPRVTEHHKIQRPAFLHQPQDHGRGILPAGQRSRIQLFLSAVLMHPAWRHHCPPSLSAGSASPLPHSLPSRSPCSNSAQRHGTAQRQRQQPYSPSPASEAL